MKSSLLFLLVLVTTLGFSQQADQSIIASQGGQSKGGTMSISWTIGDLITETSAFDDGRLTQGFQQPTITVTEIASGLTQDVKSDNATATNLSLSSRSADVFDANVYPNPVSANLHIEVQNADQPYVIELFDPAGNMLTKFSGTSSKAVLNMTDLPAAQYLLHVRMTNSDQSKLFQIVKTN